jgi:hypothetical protein
LLGFELGFIEGSDDGCNNGWIYGVEDGVEDGSPLGFELGFVGSYHDGCSKDWRDSIKDGFKDGSSLGFVLMAAAMMAVETVCRMTSMILHDMVERIKRLEIELDCILKVVSSRMPHPRATTRVGTNRSTPNLYHQRHCQGRHEAHVL